MDMSNPPAGSSPTAAVQIAKAAFKRLALAKLEPTPDNYARAYAMEAGEVALAMPVKARPLVDQLVDRYADEGQVREELSRHLLHGRWDDAADVMEKIGRRRKDAQVNDSHALAELIERMLRHIERTHGAWTPALKKESLQRVLDSSRRDQQRMRERIASLLQAWDAEGPTAAAPVEVAVAPTGGPAAVASAVSLSVMPSAPADAVADASVKQDREAWAAATKALAVAVQAAFAPGEPRAEELAAELKAIMAGMDGSPLTADQVAALVDFSQRASKLFAHRHGLLDDLGRLCAELTDGLTELAEDGSWARGQCESMRMRLAEGISARSVRAASELLAETRKRQAELRVDRNQARDSLKQLIHNMLSELGNLGDDTSRFTDSIGRHADAIEKAESIDGLAGVVKEMVSESRAVQAKVSDTQQRLHAEHQRASEMEQRVHSLESELRRLSDEVSTDALTQVANRRGLAQAFQAEVRRIEQAGPNAPGVGLGVALIDIDNFKKLNDTLGHAAGDKALQSLAAQVNAQLRNGDTVARFGGEEFVVLLPDLPVTEAQQFLTGVQRALTASLFMHDKKEVFVTFSAGVTAWRHGESLEAALERSDEALYEAKRTGKNRTCVS